MTLRSSQLRKGQSFSGHIDCDLYSLQLFIVVLLTEKGLAVYWSHIGTRIYIAFSHIQGFLLISGLNDSSSDLLIDLIIKVLIYQRIALLHLCDFCSDLSECTNATYENKTYCCAFNIMLNRTGEIYSECRELNSNYWQCPLDRFEQRFGKCREFSASYFSHFLTNCSADFLFSSVY